MNNLNAIEARVIEEAYFTIKNKSTVRNTAIQYGISKSTVHKDITTRLYDISMTLYDEVAEVLGINKMERARRGGAATKRKYKAVS